MSDGPHSEVGRGDSKVAVPHTFSGGVGTTAGWTHIVDGWWTTRRRSRDPEFLRFTEGVRGR